MPCSQINVFGVEFSTKIYTSIWEEIEQIEKEQEERRLRLAEKMKANEEKQKKKQAKKRKHMTRKQREMFERKRAKKAAKRSESITQNMPTGNNDEIILLGATWFPPGTPLKIEE